MLATGLIVFREVLEAALIIGIVMASARGAAHLGRTVGGGIAAGVIGAMIVAAFANTISDAVEGAGQEIFNATVLFLAVVMLGWHNVWMGRHGRQMAAEASALGRSVAEGGRSIYALGVVVGLAVLREGSETVLFLYGIAAAHGASLEMLSGGLAGLGVGVAIGMALYFGLVRVPTRHLFTVTAWLILLLAAGMASQGARFLVQADLLPALGSNVWDTSALLSERGLMGQTLHILVGYVARPMGIQIVFYLATIAVIGGLMIKLSPKTVATASRLAMIAAVAATFSLVGFAGPAGASHKVYSPIVIGGEFELETRGHVDFDDDDGKDGAQKQIYEIGYAFTDRWSSSIFLEVEKEPGGRLRDEAVAWENIIQIFEQGERLIDMGIYLEYEAKTRKDSPDKFEGKILLEKTMGRFIHTANIIFEKELGANADEGVELEYAWRSVYRLRPELEIAIEAFGEFGEIRDFKSGSEQEHSIGPVVMGRIKLGNKGVKLVYEAGYLFGLTRSTPDGTFKWLFEIEFPF